MQTISYVSESGLESSTLPDPSEKVMPGVKWGRHDQLFTPAYWAYHCWLTNASKSQVHYKLGGSIFEEVAACLLGGYGIRAEIGIAAFCRLRDRGQLDGRSSADELLLSLSEPFEISGRLVKYRFALQKSFYVSEALRTIQNEEMPADDLEFRSWLVRLRGIGLKTASWITRNWKDSDAVAIIDVHICRAGLLIGLYHGQQPQLHYLEMEKAFLLFAESLNVRTAVLDTIIWSHMRRWGSLARQN